MVNLKNEFPTSKEHDLNDMKLLFPFNDRQAIRSGFIDESSIIRNEPVYDAVASINNSTNSYIVSNENARIGDVIDFSFTNTSTGSYTHHEWYLNGIRSSDQTFTYSITVTGPVTIEVNLNLFFGNNVISNATEIHQYTIIYDPEFTLQRTANRSFLDATPTETGGYFTVTNGGLSSIYNWDETPLGVSNGVSTITYNINGFTSSKTWTLYDPDFTIDRQYDFIVPREFLYVFNYDQFANGTWTVNGVSRTLTGYPWPQIAIVEGLNTIVQTIPDGATSTGGSATKTWTLYNSDFTPSYQYDLPGGGSTPIAPNDFIYLTNFDHPPGSTWTVNGVSRTSTPSGYPWPQIAIVEGLNTIVHTIPDGATSTGQSTTKTYTQTNYVEPIASIDNNAATSLTTTYNGPSYTTSNISITNTTTGTYTSFTWSGNTNSPYNAGIATVINNTTTANLVFDVVLFANVPPIVVTLRIFDGATLKATITRTFAFNLLDSSVVATNMIAMVDFNPSPQDLATEYQGIHMLVVPGVPAIEPTKFRVQTTEVVNGGTLGNIWNFQGVNVNAGTISMSTDTTETNAGGNYFWRGAASASSVNDSMLLLRNWAGTAAFGISAVGRISIEFAQPINSNNYFDSFSNSVPQNYTKVYNTAYETYFSNDIPLSNSAILASTNYFGPSTGRYRPVLDNTAQVTFKLSIGKRYVALITGALRVNNTTVIWGKNSGDGYASLYTITSFVNASGEVTFGRANVGSGTQGSIFGFWSFDNIPV